MGKLIGSINHDALVKRLKISEPLVNIPSHVFNHADTLEQLDLSGTGLSSLPDSFGRLKRLKIAFFSNCKFAVFPRQLASCLELEMVAFRSNGMKEIPDDAFPPRLRWLILTDNQIETIPDSIGSCTRLQKCMLAGNRLRTLPESMASCRKLGLLRLSANHITALPTWLFDMPELSFLSFAGNPCSNLVAESLETEDQLANVPWADMATQELLGEGASGLIYRGQCNERVPQRVAIKLFRDGFTSDGTPLDEMRACIRAGGHPNLIDPLGEIQDHPEDKKGLVMQLIPPTYRTLGLPPSFQSCTRDCFEREKTLTLEQGLQILLGIASAAAYLHGRGIAHGDLYAHNILYNDGGHALLGDFGAASFYAGDRVEKLEVLAFAHLVEDILGLVAVVSGEDDAQSGRLRSLHRKCSQPDVRSRPSFAEILRELVPCPNPED